MEQHEKITVLFISASQKGGAVYSLLNMVRALKGYIIPIVVFPNRDGMYRYFVQEGIECLVVPFREEIFYVDIYKKFPLWKRFLYIPYEAVYKIALNSLFNKRVQEKLNGRKIDIVHTNTGAITIGVSLSKVLNARHLWHLREFQNLDFGARPFWGWKRFLRLLSISDAAVGITKAIANHFCLDKHRKGYVLWNAVKPEKDVVFESKKRNYILFAAANISRAKNLHLLINAYKNSCLPNAGIKLLVGGLFKDSNYKEEINRQIYEMSLTEDIEFVGYCEDLRQNMKFARAFVMPSEREAMGRVAVEAMFCGCPVIARNTGGPKEFISDGFNGLLFNDEMELTEKLETVCNSDNMTLMKNAMRFAQDNFSEEKYGKNMYKIYTEILAK